MAESQKSKKNKSLKRKAGVMEIPEEAETPPYRCELHFQKKEFVVYVTLHKIPDRFIVLHVTNEEFCLHTLNYSKKYYLKYVLTSSLLS